MAGRGEHPCPHRLTHDDHVAVTDRDPVEHHRVVSVDVIRRTGRGSQRIPTGDVVVVDVRLEHVRDDHPLRRGEVEDPVDVALWVDHERDLPVVDEVAAVAEGGRVDGQDVDHGGTPHQAFASIPWTTGRPARAQAARAAGDRPGVHPGVGEEFGRGEAAVAPGADHIDGHPAG